MRRKVYLKIARSLYTLGVLLLSLLAHDHHSSVARQVKGNVVSAQLQNNSLPALSERANGVNSRYLSAASTASLAAATVAAANGAPSSSSQEAANRNYLLHQQQQQQQHQQQQSAAAAAAAAVAASNNQQQVNQQQVGASGQQVQQNAGQSGTNSATVTGNPQQVAQFNSPQGSQVPSLSNTPIMSTTYTYNPLTGQFVPSDLSTGILSPATGGLQSPNIAAQLPNQLSQFQAQQPFFVANNPYSSPGRFGSSQSSYNPLGPQGFFAGNQFAYNQQPQNQQRIQPQSSVFNRRTGYNPFNSPSRLNSVYGGQSTNQLGDDDMSGFFQQQQQQQVVNSGNDLSGNNNYGNLDGGNNGGLTTSGVYGGNSLLQPSNSYLINANHHHSSGQQQQAYNVEHSLGSLPTSLSSTSILPTPSTSFSAAFSGPPTPSASGAESFKSDQCLAADGRHGTCYQASECIKKGGTPMGKCGSSNSVAEFSGSSYVCCLFDVTCGQFAAERFVYFRNPNYPQTYDQSRMCRAKIGKLDKGVCQFRLDLIRFDVAKPTNGNCSNDMFVVSGQNENYVIPKICGLNDGQHYYVGVDESGVITLHMMMMGYYRRSFEILITQIPCRSDYAAPAHCLQYYMGTHGTIKSFNYDDELRLGPPSGASYDLLAQQQANQAVADSSNLILNGHTAAPYSLQFGAQYGSAGGQTQQRHQQYLAAASNSNQRYTLYPSASASSLLFSGADQFGGYPNDLDYTMCIRKESGFCSITYQLSRGEQGGLQPFAVGHSLFGGGGGVASGDVNNGSTNGFGTTGWNPVSTECRDDYLLIGGVRLCSGSGGGNQQPFDLVAGSAIQFAQNGTVLNSAGISQHGSSSAGQQQHLQNQLQFLVQQLSRVQQQQLQQQQQASGNASYAGANNNNSINQQQGGSSLNNANNLEQQQAAILQQIMLIQQQLNSNVNNNINNRYQTQQQQADSQYSDLQGAIITDTTSGPFILRFVSNMARNARGFQIDYRQNPCK